jgi:biotin transport system substrate-specific component
MNDMRGEKNRFCDLCGVLGIAWNVFVIAFCTLAVLAASKLRIAFYPVPITLQTLAVVSISALIGKSRALMGLLAFAIIWNPIPLTAGYILGFFAVPFVIGNNAAKLKPATLIYRIFLSYFIVLISGAAVLSFFIGLKDAAIGGFVFFIPSEILKGILSFAIIRIFRKFLMKMER